MKPDRRSPVDMLARGDKWYLGGGNRLLWAPPFPVWLDAPGFWDPAHYYNVELGPLFTWAILDDDGVSIPLRQVSRSWTPALLACRYVPADGRGGFAVSEEKCLLPGDVASCTVRVRNLQRTSRRLHLVFWTTQEQIPGAAWLDDAAVADDTARFTRCAAWEGRPGFSVACAMGLDRPPTSFALQESEPTALQPHWHLTPFADLFAGGRLPCTDFRGQPGGRRQVSFALHRTLRLGAGGESAVSCGFAAAGTAAEARAALVSMRRGPVTASRRSWEREFRGVPAFACSDRRFTAAWWYRWYGLRLNTQRGGDRNYRHPFVCEGPGYFRAPISYSAPCQMLETRWMHNPALARGILRTFIDNRRPDGGFRGYIDVDRYRQEMFYHAHWGRALAALHAVHPDRGYLEEVYGPLAAYVRYFDRERDEEVSGMYDIDNHMETGQEYMSRYTAVDERADREDWGATFRLKGIDVTVYLYELKRALARAARRIGRVDEGDLWDIEAGRIREAVRSVMWDPASGMFSDVDPATGRRTGVRAAVCFYPYFTDIVDASHLPGLKAHLFDPGAFWTPFPVPSTAADDPSFSPAAHWRGVRRNCAWSGRVWPMTNSHVAEALGRSALRFADPELRARTAEFIGRFIGMMFTAGDPSRPNSFEHYHPFTGAPSAYRGIDDYQHSWVVDLIVTYVCGIRPEEDHVAVDPFPFGLRHAAIDGVRVRGRRLAVAVEGKRYAVRVNGRAVARRPLGEPTILDF